jgi:hypothetical protein
MMLVGRGDFLLDKCALDENHNYIYGLPIYGFRDIELD